MRASNFILYLAYLAKLYDFKMTIQQKLELQELEQRLENISSSLLEMLRGLWDVQQSSHILLSLLFYKRLISLIGEAQLPFLALEADVLDRLKLQQLQQQPNPTEIIAVFELVLLQLMQQNRALSRIFEPILLEVRKTNADHIWQVIQTLNEFDLSTSQFSIPVFGQYFHRSLYQVAIRSGKAGNDSITPPSINSLLVSLAQPRTGETVYDPAAGQGNTFVAFFQSCRKIQFLGQEIEPTTWATCQMNLWANGIYDADILPQDALTDFIFDFPQADIGVSHFPFGLNVDALQVQNAPYLQAPTTTISAPIMDGNSLFIQRILHQLADNGRAFVVLPLQVTYKDRFDKRLRELLLRRDWVEAVIALPAGLLYATGTPISIWVIRKKKARPRAQKVLFINASNLETQQKSKLYKSLHEAQIKEITQAYRLGSCEGCALLRDNVIFVSNTEIINNQYNLNPKQYASPFIQHLQELRKTQQLAQLNTLFSPEQPYVWFNSNDHLARAFQLVRVQHLGASFAEYQLLETTLDLIESPQQLTEARMLLSSALLVNTEGKKLRLSYFDFKGEPLLVARDIQIFTIAEAVNINLEYIFLQLHSDLLLQQINLFKSDHYLDSSLSAREFSHLQIILPQREEQDKIVRETKIRLLREEEQKVENLRHRLNVDKQKAQSEQNRIFSSLQHELGNRLPAILTEFKNLKDYILDKIEAQTPLSLDEPLFPLFEDEEDYGYIEQDTLAQAMKRIELLLRHTISTLDATSSIIKADKSHLQLQLTNMKMLLTEVANLYAVERNFSVQIEVEEDSDGHELQIYTHVDRMQLTTALVNLIENAKRHGFTEDKKYLVCFRLGVSADRQEVVIDYQNDGRPFPDSFSFHDFIAYGGHAGETGHSGIGGYLIYQIIENHEGTLAYREQIERSDPFKVQFEITLPLR